jgi:RHS repeat-associated protein
MTVDQTGALASVTRHDYLPFGEELPANQWGRTSGQGYAGDSVKQKYTGYERDAETSLNYAEARYHSDVQGRFTSVDPLSSSAKLTDPQTFNRYSYVGNNPTTFSDPSGMEKGPSHFYGIRDFDAILSQDRGNNTSLAEEEARYEYDLTHFTYEIQYADPVGAGIEQAQDQATADTNNQNAGVAQESQQLCPPTAKELMKNPEVKKALSDAWEASNNDFRKTLRYREHGGWIYMNTKTGKISVRLATPGAFEDVAGYVGMNLNHPPAVADSIVVGDFHTHPRPDSKQSMPSPDDIAGENRRNVPGLIQFGPGNQTRAYGPNRAGGGDKALSRTQVPGFPGREYDTRARCK